MNQQDIRGVILIHRTYGTGTVVQHSGPGE